MKKEQNNQIINKTNYVRSWRYLEGEKIEEEMTLYVSALKCNIFRQVNFKVQTSLNENEKDLKANPSIHPSVW